MATAGAMLLLLLTSSFPPAAEAAFSRKPQDGELNSRTANRLASMSTMGEFGNASLLL
jgi:hypothetical protein